MLKEKVGNNQSQRKSDRLVEHIKNNKTVERQ